MILPLFQERPGRPVVWTFVLSGQEHGLDFQRLLGASTYKEAYRKDMIRWGEEKRQADPGFFCRKVVEGISQPIWVSGSAAFGHSPSLSASSLPAPPAESHRQCELWPWPWLPSSSVRSLPHPAARTAVWEQSKTSHCFAENLCPLFC